MSPSENPDAEAEPARVPGDGIHLEATASDAARVYQSGRDQHIHHPRGVRDQRAAARDDPVRECPYPGLAAFGPEQAGWFFGRDKLVAELVTRLDQRQHTGGMQLVIAPSGAGKSSLLRAGLLPKLDHAALPGSDRWPKVVLTPTVDPLWVLAANLARLTDTDVLTLVGDLAEDPSRCVAQLADAVRDRADDPHARVVVVVDQFEELFTLCTDDRQRRAFIEVLVRLAGGPTGGGDPIGVVVVGLRVDFYAACVDHPRLRAALQDAPLVVGPMSDEELREAISFPANDVGLAVEPGLVELLLHDLGSTAEIGANGVTSYEAGRLPLLAHALRASWQQRDGSVLTVQGYRHTGHIRHAVATTAEEVYANLDGAGRLLAQSLFLRLTKIGDGTEDTRRRVPRAELLDSGTDPAAAAAVVDAFTRARLLTQQRDTVEITHEVLLRSWPRLREWIDTDRVGRLTQQNLEEAATAWHHHGGDQSLLYRGFQLDTAHNWASTAPHNGLSPTAQGFLTASTRARRRSTRRRTTTIAALATLTLVASTTAVIAVVQRGESVHQRDSAVYSRVLAEADQLRGTDTSLSAQLNLVAHRMQPDDETYTRLLNAENTPLSTPLPPHKDQVSSAVFSPDGHTLATGGKDNTVRLWNVTDPTRPTQLGQSLTTNIHDAVYSLAFSPDSRVLAVAENDKTVSLWNVADPARPIALGQPLVGHRNAVSSVAFSPDGHILATGSADKSVLLWDVTDPTQPKVLGQPLVGPTDIVWSVAFSPDGHTLAVGDSDKSVWLWNITDPTQPKVLGQPLTGGHSNMIISVAFSPDGRTLATGSGDQTVRLWNVADPTQPKVLGQPLTGHTNIVLSVAFSPDGHTLASASGDQTVRLWNVSDPNQPTPLGQPLAGHTNAVASVAFSPDGRTLATGSYDSSVRLWALPDTLLTGHADAVRAVAFSPDGRTLATAGYDRSLRLWNLTDPRGPTPLGGALIGSTAALASVAFSQDGRTLATGSFDQTARLWNVTDPARPKALGQLTSHAGAVMSVAFSPDGHTLATGGYDKAVSLWNVTDPARPRALGQPLKGYGGSVNSVVFSPDGHTLATGGTDGLLRLWNVSDPGRAALLGLPLTGHNNIVWTVAFSPDGHLLASGSGDQSVRLWDVTDPVRPKTLGQLTGHTNTVYSVAFSPDGRTIASGSSDTTVRLWHIADPNHPTALGRPLTGHTNYVYSVAFSPDGHTLASGSADKSARLWEVPVERDIGRICSATRDTLTAPQWQNYVGNGMPYAPPCG
ncbi:hypothetical protein F0L68_31105 [Solihabitans fulvus]|uniref:Novel STAND NTPase 1 domain-containing protein n=1 Tax=Solihabitans fulvus TaxID=1892852 RepID=A0A5B2WQR1_9PSEU|nr:hypothetical protein [Solihabitans fulvus]KAA2254061.1 hypothetical protein F0L68_31105 [Solihabitans fulvus]